jgi:hypothetical protein
MAMPAEAILERQREIKESQSRFFGHEQELLAEGASIFKGLHEITQDLKDMVPDTEALWFQMESKLRSTALEALDPALSNMPLERAIQVLSILTAVGLEQAQINAYRQVISEYEAVLSQARSLIAVRANEEDRIIWHFIHDAGAREIVQANYDQGKLDAAEGRVSQPYTADEFRKRFGLS